ncbi:hypothetical protein ORB00_005532 [Escherichia coli]|nr:hypothetical protein [Escherichia coli]EIA9392156.1 hypothetical protein [Escherichia coli]EIQ3772930.1 hypothetical protein [Escherichia coli]EIQ3773937.1 hypothetical protein [Escherichia coli]EJC3293363.1 hypothetical protein [Escherichia coli]
MTLTLLTAYNAPYLAALTFVLLTGIAELIALLCGHSLSSAMDRGLTLSGTKTHVKGFWS